VGRVEVGVDEDMDEDVEFAEAVVVLAESVVDRVGIDEDNAPWSEETELVTVVELGVTALADWRVLIAVTITVESTGVDVKELVVDIMTVGNPVEDAPACIEVLELEDAASGTAGVCIVVKIVEATAVVSVDEIDVLTIVELQEDVEVGGAVANEPQELGKKLAFL
jgi:hypothetical protein